MRSEPADLARTIAELVRSAAPVTPLDGPAVRLLRWLAATTVLLGLGVAMRGPRADLGAQLLDGWFIARAAITVAIGVSAAVVGLLMSAPGLEPSPARRLLPLSGLVVWVAVLASTLDTGRSAFDLLLSTTVHPSCPLLIAAMAVPPAFVLVSLLRSAAPLQARWTAGLAGLASLAAGALGTQFVCPNDAAMHQLLWHAAPVLLLTLASVAAGTAVFAGAPRRHA